MKIFLVLTFAYLSGTTGFDFNQDCLVKTKNGLVQGYASILPISGKEYESYKCIPYAEPPVGKFRFWPPISKNSWEGIYDATRTSCPVCPQKDLNGTEDCLYLNVFVPRNCGKKSLKTIFYIEGTGFVRGGGLTEPSKLLEECVIVVTLNYRLGAFGFLSLQTPGCAGNVGLKDQQLALKWVKENIHYFGGDSNHITLMGHSAGAASVTYHYINQESCTLFDKGIAQSGNALMPWAFIENDVALYRARNLAEFAGCSGSDEELCECLKFLPAEIIVEITPIVQARLELFTMTMYSFVPTTEIDDSPQPFLKRTPTDLLSNGLHCKNAPLIIGLAQNEGCVFKESLKTARTFLPLLSLMIKVLAPQCMAKSLDSTCSEKVARSMLDRFVGEGLMNENNTAKIMGEVQFQLETYKCIDLLAKNQVDVYLYSYTFNGKCSTSKETDSESTEVCHGDHVPYEFLNEIAAKCLDEPQYSPDRIVSKRLTAMWSNFAEYGSPTPLEQPRDLYSHDFNWPVWRKDSPLYCEIGSELLIRSCLGQDVATFWNELSNECCVEEKGLDQYSTCSH